MKKTKNYLFSHFITTFSSLVFTLFAIVSVIFFIQISRISVLVELSFSELGKLYIFTLPRVLLFSVSIAFFTALAMSLFRLSRENELIAIFSLGYSPIKLTKFFTLVAALLSFILLVVGLIFMPIASELNYNFVEHKKLAAKINLKTSEFGQKFGDWSIFIEQKDENSYKNATLFNGKDTFITAKSAGLKNKNSVISLELEQGKIYRLLKENIVEASFEHMSINSNINSSFAGFESVAQYWQKMKTSKNRRENFSTYTLTALLPLASVFFALGLGIFSQRYEKSMIYVGIFAVLICYFTSITILAKMPLIAIPSILGASMLTGFLWLRKKVLKRF